MSALELHFRIWNARTAHSLCRRSTQATTTPTRERVTCKLCKALIDEGGK